MSDKSFTLLEVHLGDGDIQIGPLGLDIAPDEQTETAGVTGEAETNAEAAASDDGDDSETDSKCGCCSAKSLIGVLLAVGLLAAAVIAASRLLGDDEEVPSGIAGDA